MREDGYGVCRSADRYEARAVLMECGGISIDAGWGPGIVFNGVGAISHARIDCAEHRMAGFVRGAKLDDMGDEIFRFRFVEEERRLCGTFDSGEGLRTLHHRSVEGVEGGFELCLPAKGEAEKEANAAVARSGAQILGRCLL